MRYTNCTIALILLSQLWLSLPCPGQTAGIYEHYQVYDTDLFPQAEYAARRQNALARMDSGSAMLLLAAEPATRSNDVQYPYRQSSNMLYLTGVTEDGSALLLTQRPVTLNGRVTREILFVKPRNPGTETWTGLLMGPQAAVAVTGIAVVLPVDQLRATLDIVLPQCGTVYCNPDQHLPQRDRFGSVSPKGPPVSQLLQGHQVMYERDILSALRMIKSPAEITMMRKAIEITIEAHRRTIGAAAPGMKEYELQAVMEGTFMTKGSEFPGYPSVIGSGGNSCILHYTSNRRPAATGNLVLMDCGAEYHGYTADVTRTIPMNGKFTPEQRAVYDLVLQAQDSGIAACRAGNDFREPHRRAVRVIQGGLLRLGIITDSNDVRIYFNHGTSHYLGIDVHDVGTYSPLKPGVVITVEPGIYIPSGSKCDPKWWNIGVRIEDDILITAGDPDNLSGTLERAAADIERLTGSKRN